MEKEDGEKWVAKLQHPVPNQSERSVLEFEKTQFDSFQ